MKAGGYPMLEKLAETGALIGVDPETTVQTLASEFKATRKKMGLLPTVRESEALPELQLLRQVLQRLNRDANGGFHKVLTSDAVLQRMFWEDYLLAVCGEVMRARVYCNKEIVWVANDIFAETVALATRKLGDESPLVLAVLELILDKHAAYYASNGREPNHAEFPFGEPLDSKHGVRAWLLGLKKGDPVDCLKNYGNRRVWSRGTYQGLDGNLTKVRFHDDSVSSFVTNAEYELAPLGSKSTDFEWREALKVGDLVDYFHFKSEWVLARVESVNHDDNMIGDPQKSVIVRPEPTGEANEGGIHHDQLQASRTKAAAMSYANEVSSFLPKAEQTFSVKVHTPSLMPPGSRSGKEVQGINDSEDEALLAQVKVPKWAILRPEGVTKNNSVFFIKNLNEFGANGGYDFLVQAAKTPNNLRQETSIALMPILQNSAEYLVRPFISEHGMLLLAWLTESVRDIIEKSIRVLGPSHLANYLDAIGVFAKRVHQEPEASLCGHNSTVRISVICLRSEILEKQFFGAKKLIEIEDRIKGSDPLGLRPKLAQLLVDENIYEKIIKGHPSLIEKASGTLKVLFTENRVTDGQIGLLWDQVRKADMESKFALLGMLEATVRDMSATTLRVLLDQVIAKPIEVSLELLEVVSAMRKTQHALQGDSQLPELLNGLIRQTLNDEALEKPELIKELMNSLVDNIPQHARADYFLQAIRHLLAGHAKERNLKLLIKMMKKPGLVDPETAENIRKLKVVAFCVDELQNTFVKKAKISQEVETPVCSDPLGTPVKLATVVRAQPMRPNKVLKFLSVAIAQPVPQGQPPLFAFQDFEGLWKIIVQNGVREKMIVNWLFDFLKIQRNRDDLDTYKRFFVSNLPSLTLPGTDEFFTFFMFQFMIINELEGCFWQARLELENCVSSYKMSSKTVYVPQRQFWDMFGASLFWKTFLEVSNAKLAEEIANFLVNLNVPPEFGERLNPAIFVAQKQHLFQKSYELFMNGDAVGAQKASLILAKIVKYEEQRIGSGLVSFGQLREGDRLRVYYEKEHSYLKQRHTMEATENMTVAQLKELVATENKVPFELVGMVTAGGSELRSQDNMSTLAAMCIENLEVLVYRERETEKVEFKLLNGQGSAFSEASLRALKEVFDEFADERGLSQAGIARMFSWLKSGTYNDLKSDLDFYFSLNRIREDQEGKILEADTLAELRMDSEEFFKTLLSTVKARGESGTVQMKQWMLSLGFNKKFRSPKYPLENSLDVIRSFTRFKLAQDTAFYAKLLGHISQNTIDTQYGPCMSTESREDIKESESFHFLTRLLEILPPCFQDVAAAWVDPTAFLSSANDAFTGFYRSVILNALAFRPDFVRMLTEMFPEDYTDKHSTFLTRFLTPKTLKQLLRCIASSKDQLKVEELPSKAISAIRLLERLLKSVLGLDDLKALLLLKSLSSYVVKRRMRAHEAVFSNQNAVTSDSKAQRLRSGPVKDEKDPEELRISLFQSQLVNLNLTASLRSSLKCDQIVSVLIDFLANFIPDVSDNGPGHSRLIRSLSVALICAVRLLERDTTLVSVSDSFWETMVVGLSSHSAICRLFFKNTFAMIAIESQDIRFKTAMLNYLIHVVGSNSKEELHGIVELTCAILEDIGELKAARPDVAEYLHSHLNFRELFDRFYSLLVHYESPELNQEIDCEPDPLLQSYLALIERVFRIDEGVVASLDPELRESLVSFVFNRLLFGLHKKTIDYRKALCKSRRCRQLALDWMRQLLRGDNEVVYEFIQNRLRPFLTACPVFTPQSQFTANPERRLSAGYVGIKNPGCVCYMIATLQQFYCTSPFRYGLMMASDGTSPAIKEVSGRKVDDNLFHQIQWMFANLEGSLRRDFDPSDFCFSYKDYSGEPTNMAIQQDADEFLKVLLERMENNLKGTPFLGVLNSVFLGRVCNVITCKECGHEKTNEESFFNISLEVKKMRGLQESLDKLVQEEIISDYLCDACKKKCDISKRALLKRLPNVLIFSLKKMCFDLELLMNVKIHSRYEFPMNVNLADFVYKSSPPKAAPESGEEEAPGATMTEPPLLLEDCEYRLVGVVVHKGNAEFGHYTSLISGGRADPGRPGQSADVWWEFDDSKVSKFDMAKFEEECFGSSDDKDGFGSEFMAQSMVSKSAYLLFYEKVRKDPLVFPVTENDPETRSLIMKHLIDPKDVQIGSDSVMTSFHNLGPFMPPDYERAIASQNTLLALEQIILAKSFTTFLAEFVSEIDLELSPEVLTSPLSPETKTKLWVARKLLVILPEIIFKIFGVAYENFKIKQVVNGVQRALKTISLASQIDKSCDAVAKVSIGSFFINVVSANHSVLVDTIVTTSDYPLRLGLMDFLVCSITAAMETFALSGLKEPTPEEEARIKETELGEETPFAGWQQAVTLHVLRILGPIVDLMERLQSWTAPNKRFGVMFKVIKRLCEANTGVLQWLAGRGFLTTVYELYLNSDADKHMGLEQVMASLLGLIRVFHDFHRDYPDPDPVLAEHVQNLNKKQIIRKALSENFKEDEHSELRAVVQSFATNSRRTTVELVQSLFLRNLSIRFETRLIAAMEALGGLVGIQDDLQEFRMRLILGWPVLHQPDPSKDGQVDSLAFGLARHSDLKATVYNYLGPYGKPGLLDLLWSSKIIETRLSIVFIYYLVEWAITYPAMLHYLLRLEPPCTLSATVFDWWKAYAEFHMNAADPNFSGARSEAETLISTQMTENLRVFEQKARDAFCLLRGSLSPDTLVFSSGFISLSSFGSPKQNKASLEDLPPLARLRPGWIIWGKNFSRGMEAVPEDEEETQDVVFEIDLVNVNVLESDPRGTTNLAIPHYLIKSNNTLRKAVAVTGPVKDAPTPDQEERVSQETKQKDEFGDRIECEDTWAYSDSENDLETKWDKPNQDGEGSPEANQVADAPRPALHVTPSDFILRVSGRYQSDKSTRVSVKVAWPDNFGEDEQVTVREMNVKNATAVFHVLTLPAINSSFNGVRIYAAKGAEEDLEDAPDSRDSELHWNLIFDGTPDLPRLLKQN